MIIINHFYNLEMYLQFQDTDWKKQINKGFCVFWSFYD